MASSNDIWNVSIEYINDMRRRTRVAARMKILSTYDDEFGLLFSGFPPPIMPSLIMPYNSVCNFLESRRRKQWFTNRLEIMYGDSCRYHLGDNFRFRTERYEFHSIELIFTIMATGGFVYKFVKDYPTLRNGIIAIKSDMQRLPFFSNKQLVNRSVTRLPYDPDNF